MTSFNRRKFLEGSAGVAAAALDGDRLALDVMRYEPRGVVAALVFAAPAAVSSMPTTRHSAISRPCSPSSG